MNALIGTIYGHTISLPAKHHEYINCYHICQLANGSWVREERVEMRNLMVATTAGTVGKEIQKGIF